MRTGRSAGLAPLRLGLLLGLLLGFGLGGGAAGAGAVTDWRIERFEAAVEVFPDGAFEVVETIGVEFLSPRHGLLRDIPLEGLELRVLGVTDGHGRPRPYRLEWLRRGGRTYRRVRVGDPERYVRGLQTYVIRYRVEGALGFFEEHDELYWNVTGQEWPVPIPYASATVRLPRPLAPEAWKLRCFTGPRGSRAEECTYDLVDPRTVRFEARGLGAYEGLTVVVGFPKGLVREPSPLTTLWKRYGRYALLPLLTLGGMLGLWWRFGRDPRLARSVMPRWDPPEGLRPAEVGVLSDERADLRDLSATLIDLAVRGYLKIRALGASGADVPRFATGRAVGAGVGAGLGGLLLVVSLLWTVLLAWVGLGWLAAFALPFFVAGVGLLVFGILGLRRGFRFRVRDYELIRLREPDEGLKPHERELLQALFDGERTRRLSQLERRFYVHLPRIRQALYRALVEGGYFPRSPESVRATYAVIGILGVMGGVLFALWLQGDWRWAASFAASGLIVTGFAPLMPRKTRKGARAAREVQGLREYLGRAERHRLEVLNPPERTPEHFEELLPYAIALGVAQAWAERFEGLYREPPRWYEGPDRGPFSSRRLVHELREFACNAERACTSAPQGTRTSGFAGGSAGGGRGGGGGGVW